MTLVKDVPQDDPSTNGHTSLEEREKRKSKNPNHNQGLAKEDVKRDDASEVPFTSNFPLGSLETLFGFIKENWSYIVGQGDVVPAAFDTITNEPEPEAKAIWIGGPYNMDSEKTFFEGVYIGGEEYRVFDNVVLSSDRTRQQLPIIVRIVALFEEGSRKSAIVECYYRPADILSIMNILRVSGENPLIFLHESQDEDTVKPQKRKRGRPPKKRMLNIEDSISTLESCTENEIFTSLRPYVDCVSISSFNHKCTVDHVQPVWTPNQSSKMLKDWYFYRKALELKNCSLIICKPRPIKPRSWIDLIEKRNKDKRYSLPNRERYEHTRMDISTQPNMFSSKIKKRKRFSDDDEAEDLFEEESSLISENSLDDASLSRMSQPVTISSRTETNITEPHNRSDKIFPHLMEKMESMSELITQSLFTMQEAIEHMQDDVLVNLEEIKKSLHEIKSQPSSDISIAPAENLVDDFSTLNSANTFPSEIFNSFI